MLLPNTANKSTQTLRREARERIFDSDTYRNQYRLSFGKYKNQPIVAIPLAYLVWLRAKASLPIQVLEHVSNEIDRRQRISRNR